MKRLLALLVVFAALVLGACSSGGGGDGDGDGGGIDTSARTVNGSVTDYEGAPISGATVNAYDESVQDLSRAVARADGDPIDSATTDADGGYTLTLEPGEYRVVITSTGNHETVQYITIQATNQAGEPISAAPSLAIPTTFDLEATGTTSGTIVDASTGDPISGVALTVRAGIGNTSGDAITTGATNASGEFSFSLPTGVYCVSAAVEDYADTTFTVVALANESGSMDIDGVTYGRTFSMSSAESLIGTDGLRIVLTWGQNPSDLDSHLLTPAISGQKYHLFYGSAYLLEDGFDPVEAPYAALDLDDVTSYGPETTTIVTPQSGNYTYYVHHFAGSSTLSLSGAKVEVYDANGLIRTYYVPTNGGSALYWKVFSYDGGTGVITTINQFTDTDLDPWDGTYNIGYDYSDYYGRGRAPVTK